jgi:hypothetical protein
VSGKPYAFKPAAHTALLVLDGGGFEVVTGSGTKWSGQVFGAQGLAQGKSQALSLSQLLRRESFYNEDIDGDGSIGDFVQTVLSEKGLYKAKSGAFVIDGWGDGEVISKDAMYLSVGTKAWTPGQATVLGWMEIGGGLTEVLLQSRAAFSVQLFNLVGAAQGKAVSLRGDDLVKREYFYGDLNGDQSIQFLGVPSGWDEALFLT